jgi:hypothetical protein
MDREASRFRSWLTGPRIGVAFFVVSLLGVLRANAFALRPPQWLSPDEGYASAIGLRLVHDGGLPYVNAVSQRGPLMYWIYELVVRVGGTFDVRAIRWGGIFFTELLVVCAFVAARSLGSRLGAGVAALFVALNISVFTNPSWGLALNGEIIAMSFVLLSFAATALALRDGATRPTAWLAVAGVVGALAPFTKQSAAGHVAVCLVWICLAKAPMRQRATRAAAFSAGVLAVVAIVLAPYVASHSLSSFFYYFSTYGRSVYLAPTTSGDVAHVAFVYFIKRYNVFPFIACAAWLWRRGALPEWMLLANVAAAIPEAVFTGRGFGHYFLPYETLLAVTLGVTFESVGRAVPSFRDGGRAASIAALAILVVAWPKGPSLDASAEPAMPKSSFDPSTEPVGQWVAAHTSPGDRIFVWGFRGDIYSSAHRYPASRWVYTQYQAGFAPWVPQPLAVEETLVVSGSRESTIADLEETRCEIVVDAGGSLMNRYMTTYAFFKRYLDEHYCLADVVIGIPIYRRKHEDACAPIPDAPHAALFDMSMIPAWIEQEKRAEAP